MGTENKYDKVMDKFENYSVINNGERGEISNELISKFESIIKASLPLNYIEFLAKYGGNAFDEYVLFPYLESYPGGDEGIVNVFFGLSPNKNDCYDLIYNFETYFDRMPREFIPIADDPGGNLICLAVGGDKKDKVYFWDHEQEAAALGNAQPWYKNLYLLAASFEVFLNSLYKE